MMPLKSWKLLLVACGVLLISTVAWGWADQVYQDKTFIQSDHPAIQYSEGPLNDPITLLGKKLESGTAKLEPRPEAPGYLLGILKSLDINPDSQVMVFSKTSFQAALISPKNPRALFFNDDNYIGYVRGSDVLEGVSVDPRQGPIFYTFDQRWEKPGFLRRDVCMQCHNSDTSSNGVPGLMVASVFPDAEGMPAFRGAQALTDDRTRFEERWGGWYVSGTHGDQRHRGNAVGHDRQHPDVLDTAGTQNLISLARKFEPTSYPAAVSDIVALMTLEHQCRMTNLFIRVGWQERIAEHDHADAAARAQIDAGIDAIATYMLFAEAAPLLDEVQGVSTFSKTFPARGPLDTKGRTLREFDLKTRLFKYPLSYMIYSRAFDALPDYVREGVYRRLYEVLTGKDQNPKFAKLSAEDRRNVLEIVRETKRGLPAYWREPVAPVAGE
ncbi:MAG TPA: hypothetical protein VN841_20720 [Bryobacteraceae bacterium]|nr:hypothetical protein [Bryobacteraceae bacterium]